MIKNDIEKDIDYKHLIRGAFFMPIFMKRR